MTLTEMLEIAKDGGSVRWSDGTVTPVSLEDSHLFGMVLCRRLPSGEVEPLRLAETYDAETYDAETFGGKEPGNG